MVAVALSYTRARNGRGNQNQEAAPYECTAIVDANKRRAIISKHPKALIKGKQIRTIKLGMYIAEAVSFCIAN